LLAVIIGTVYHGLTLPVGVSDSPRDSPVRGVRFGRRRCTLSGWGWLLSWSQGDLADLLLDRVQRCFALVSAVPAAFPHRVG